MYGCIMETINMYLPVSFAHSHHIAAARTRYSSIEIVALQSDTRDVCVRDEHSGSLAHTVRYVLHPYERIYVRSRLTVTNSINVIECSSKELLSMSLVLYCYYYYYQCAKIQLSNVNVMVESFYLFFFRRVNFFFASAIFFDTFYERCQRQRHKRFFFCYFYRFWMLKSKI